MILPFLLGFFRWAFVAGNSNYLNVKRSCLKVGHFGMISTYVPFFFKKNIRLA